MVCKEILLPVTTLWHSVLKKLLKKRYIALFKVNHVDYRHEQQPESTWNTGQKYYRSLRPIFITFFDKKRFSTTALSGKKPEIPGKVGLHIGRYAMYILGFFYRVWKHEKQSFYTR